jgi:outer membrane biogenesis lipoprotein LolB
MRTLFLSLLVIVALNLIGCATTSTQAESLKQPKWQQQMSITQPRR